MALVKKLVPTVKAKVAALAAPKAKVEVGSLQLPAGLSKPSEDMQDYTWLIYGERKIGKTTLAAQFPDALFFMFEPGGRALKLRQVACPNWETFLGYIKLLEEQPNYCRTVVIDTGFNCYERCFEYCLKQLGISKPADEAWGSAWKFIDKEFRVVHERILNLGLGFIVTAHSEIKEIQRRDGSKYNKLTTQLGGQAFRYYGGIVDIIAYYCYDPLGKRELIISGDANVDAGNRCKGHFVDKVSGERLKIIPMGNSEETAFKNLSMAFENQLSVAPKTVMKKEVAK